MVSVATPEELTGAVPNGVVPLRKLTVPAGTMLPVPWTAAVKVSVWPVATTFGDAFRLVVVVVA